jgi:hypothetical protein
MIERDGGVGKPPVAVGDKVWLSTQKLKLARGAGTKLVPRWIGPFDVESLPHDSPNAVKLALPSSFKARHTWNLEYIKPYVHPQVPLMPNHTDFGYDIEELVGSEAPLVEDEAVELVRSPVELYFYKLADGHRYFKVRFDQEDWSTCEVLKESAIESLTNGKALIGLWEREHTRPVRK